MTCGGPGDGWHIVQRVTDSVRDAIVESGRGRRVTVIRVIGVTVAGLAIALCVRTLVDSWPDVRETLADARPGWLLLALLASAAAMAALGLAWWRCLRAFGVEVPLLTAMGWYFGGELGKYLPGGVWAAVGRGELAVRSRRIDRSTAYGTVLLSYAAMCIAAAAVCGLLGPVIAITGHGRPAWAWLAMLLLPAVALTHPRVLGAAPALAGRLSNGRITLVVPAWPTTARLVAWSVPAWVLLGGAAAAVTEALGLAQSPVRVALAAVAAWMIGFLVVPVPAGAGVRELVFVGLCGLSAAPAVAVAVLARALLIVVDASGGVAGLGYSARHALRGPVTDPSQRTARSGP